jgi:6-phosphogluconolactonase
MTFVYTSCADSGELWVLALDEARGTLEPRQTLAGLGQVMPLALDARRRRLYAARRSEPWAVLSFAVDPAEGRLHPLGEAPLPHSMAYLSTEASGRWLLSASYPGDQVAVSPLDATGLAGPATQVLPTGRHAHCLQVSPDQRFAYAALLGEGQVLHWRFDAANGRLGPAAPGVFTARPGAGPRHLRFDADGRRAVLLNELDGTLDLLARDPHDGTLTALQTQPLLPVGSGLEPWAAEVRFAPGAAFVYASERRSSTLAGFAVEAEGLRPIGRWPTEAQPRSFAITPSGRWLVAAGQASHTLGVHRVSRADGTLSAGRSTPVGLNPNWVEVLATDTAAA